MGGPNLHALFAIDGLLLRRYTGFAAIPAHAELTDNIVQLDDL